MKHNLLETFILKKKEVDMTSNVERSLKLKGNRNGQCWLFLLIVSLFNQNDWTYETIFDVIL